MAESKRTFQGAKMDRDIDDRLLKSGDYRYALNVNIGESEGSDVGSLENIKGNELIAGQDGIEGTVIGSVKDPNSDRIYWFTKGDTADAIYEYDDATGDVSTILLDEVSNPLVKPTCTPELIVSINDPDSDTRVRPPAPTLPTPPVGTCMLATGPNGRSNTNFNPAGDFADNGICIEEPAPPDPPSESVDPIARITGSTIGTSGGDAIPLSGSTSTPGELTGGAAATITDFAWSYTPSGGTEVTGTGDSFSVAAPAADESITVSLTITNSGGDTDSDTHTIVFSLDPPETFTFSAGRSGSITNATISGGQGQEQGIENIAEQITYTVEAEPDSTFEWLTLPTIPQVTLPAGFTQTPGGGGAIGNDDPVSLTVTGSWTPIADINVTHAITGGSTVLSPEPFTCSLGGTPLVIATSGASNSISISTSPEVPFTPTFGRYIFNITGPTGATSATATQLGTGTPGVNGFRFTSSSNPDTEPLGVSGGSNTFTAGDATPAGNYNVTVTVNHPTDGRTFTSAPCPFTIQAAIVTDFTFSLPNGLPTSVVRGSTGNSFVFRITSNFVANGVQAVVGIGAGGIITSPANINGETHPNPSSLPIGDSDFTITFDVGASATHTEVTFNAVATNRDPFDGGQGNVNANAFTSEIPGSDGNGVFHIPIVEA